MLICSRSIATDIMEMPLNSGPNMASKGAHTAKSKAPDTTYQEVLYLRHLIDEKIPVRMKMTDGEEVAGLIEFFDVGFLRLTRPGEANLFVYKHDIKYLYEEGE
jgi:host factor-I protein